MLCNWVAALRNGLTVRTVCNWGLWPVMEMRRVPRHPRFRDINLKVRSMDTAPVYTERGSRMTVMTTGLMSIPGSSTDGLIIPLMVKNWLRSPGNPVDLPVQWKRVIPLKPANLSVARVATMTGIFSRSPRSRG